MDDTTVYAIVKGFYEEQAVIAAFADEADANTYKLNASDGEELRIFPIPLLQRPATYQIRYRAEGLYDERVDESYRQHSAWERGFQLTQDLLGELSGISNPDPPIAHSHVTTVRKPDPYDMTRVAILDLWRVSARGADQAAVVAAYHAECAALRARYLNSRKARQDAILQRLSSTP